MKKEGGGKSSWFLCEHFPDPAYIRRENDVNGRSQAGREFVQMPPQSTVGIYTLSSSSSSSPLTLQNSLQASRRKPKDDDAAYVGASGSKRPRDSVDKTVVPDGRRAKRKRVQSAYDTVVSFNVLGFMNSV